MAERKRGVDHDFTVVARRVVEQAIGEKLHPRSRPVEGHMKLMIAALAGAILMAPTSSAADIITFGNANVDLLVNQGVRTEAGFNYQAFGVGWELQNVYSVSGAALATFFNGDNASVNDRVDFTRTGGGVFTFDSIQFRTVGDGLADDVIIRGFLMGVEQGSVAITTSPTTFQTINSTFSTPIDLLRMSITFATMPGPGGFAMILDNVALTPTTATPVPEPASMTLLGLGLAATGVRRWRKRRPVTRPS